MRYDDEEPMTALADVASALLKQAYQLLDQIIARGDGESILTHESALIPGSTIGKHLRHVLDHYKLLLDSVPRTSPSNPTPLHVNYDKRIRLVDMERDPRTARQCFSDVDDTLSEIRENVSLDHPLRLSALTPIKQDLSSSFGRELWFVALHAIHHFSLLRVIACGELHLAVPDNFGVAPSTLAFRQVAKDTRGKLEPERMEKVAEQVAGKVKL